MRPPSVDALARSIADVGLPHALLVDAARAAIAADDPDSARARAEEVSEALLRPVVNATGVLLHTNLGRAPIEHRHAPTYSNLEFDLATGARGSRHVHASRLLARLCGAEEAMVVNNNAAAVLLVLATLAAGREVLVSRGESVEIGGGFRVPEVMAQSGARLVDVGTTNRTRVDDYRAALTDRSALVLKVHPSNYRIEGFTESASVESLADLPVPVVADLGSGLLDAACPWLDGPPPAWLAGEPAALQTLRAGAALVTFSGDKLMGGPQAGIIAGRRELVAACARHPLARALRPGALVLAAVQETALAYLRRDGLAIPFWRAATRPVEQLRNRAMALGVGEPLETAAIPGAGSAPGVTIPSFGVALRGDHLAALRAADPPIIARLVEHRTICDLRTVEAAHDGHLAATLTAITA
jgi:L-seryl-tRNA(Ser) seleniumtransferase